MNILALIKIVFFLIKSWKSKIEVKTTTTQPSHFGKVPKELIDNKKSPPPPIKFKIIDSIFFYFFTPPLKIETLSLYSLLKTLTQRKSNKEIPKRIKEEISLERLSVALHAQICLFNLFLIYV